MTERESNRNTLENIGFKRVGKSDLLTQGEFVVRVEGGGQELMVDYDEGMDWRLVVGIKQGRSYGGFSLITLSNQGSAIERTVNGSGGGVRDGVISASDFRNISIEDQLIKSGFQRDGNEPSVFSITLPDEGNIKIYAIAESGVLQKVIKPIRKRTLELAGEKFEITDYKRSRGFLDKQISVVTLKSNRVQYDVSSEYGGSVIEESVKTLRTINADDLGLSRIPEKIDSSGFVIGGKNSTRLIRNIGSLNDQSIADLEKRLKPGRDSMAGFMGASESFLDVLSNDNDFVLGENFTHQDLAEPLLFAREFSLKGLGRDFEYKGKKYKVETTSYRGMQFSPFNDHTSTNIDMNITNIESGENLSCSGLLPDMIARYGFYEGKGTSYRLEPSKIIDMFFS